MTRVGDAKALFSNIVVNAVLQNVEKQSKNVVRSCIAQDVYKVSYCRGWLARDNKMGSPTTQLRWP